MVVSRQLLRRCFSQKLLINLNAYTTTGANGTELNIDAIEVLKEDPLYDAFKEDGSPKTGWRDLTEDDILGLVVLVILQQKMEMFTRLMTMYLHLQIYLQVLTKYL